MRAAAESRTSREPFRTPGATAPMQDDERPDWTALRLFGAGTGRQDGQFRDGAEAHAKY
jgi:hypothetical protein